MYIAHRAGGHLSTGESQFFLSISCPGFWLSRILSQLLLRSLRHSNSRIHVFTECGGNTTFLLVLSNCHVCSVYVKSDHAFAYLVQGLQMWQLLREVVLSYHEPVDVQGPLDERKLWGRCENCTVAGISVAFGLGCEYNVCWFTEFPFLLTKMTRDLIGTFPMLLLNLLLPANATSEGWKRIPLDLPSCTIKYHFNPYAVQYAPPVFVYG